MWANSGGNFRPGTLFQAALCSRPNSGVAHVGPSGGSCPCPNFSFILSAGDGPVYSPATVLCRVSAADMFKEGKFKVLVGTDIASRGLDIDHVDVVVNYSLPTSTKGGPLSQSVFTKNEYFPEYLRLAGMRASGNQIQNGS